MLETFEENGYTLFLLGVLIIIDADFLTLTDLDRSRSRGPSLSTLRSFFSLDLVFLSVEGTADLKSSRLERDFRLFFFD